MHLTTHFAGSVSPHTATDDIAHKCTSVYICELRVFLMKNSILWRTTDILSAAATFLHSKNSRSKIDKEVNFWTCHGGRWFQTAVSFSIEKLVVKQLYTDVQLLNRLLNLTGKAAWMPLVPRNSDVWGFASNSSMKNVHGCTFFIRGDKPHESQERRSCSRGSRPSDYRRRSTPRNRPNSCHVRRG